VAGGSEAVVPLCCPKLTKLDFDDSCPVWHRILGKKRHAIDQECPLTWALTGL
jgi:hypothetical protein